MTDQDRDRDRDQDAADRDRDAADRDAADRDAAARDTAGRPRNARPRDRDAAGRPRNARPRDAFGRPLARGQAGETPVPDDLSLPAAEALALAQRLLDSGRPFQAHEVLEATWKSAPAAERDLWQGLAQVAVGLTHAQRGNARGAVALLRRGADRVSAFLPGGGEAGGEAGAGVGGEAGGEAGADAGGEAGAGVGGEAGARVGGDSGREGGRAGGSVLHGVDVVAVTQAAGELATRIERDGLDRVVAADLSLRLRAGDA